MVCQNQHLIPVPFQPSTAAGASFAPAPGGSASLQLMQQQQQAAKLQEEQLRQQQQMFMLQQQNQQVKAYNVTAQLSVSYVGLPLA